MTTITAKATPQLLQAEWIPFSGGELEGRRPRALCPGCREALNREAHVARRPGAAAGLQRPLCFSCYRLELERERAIKAAGELDTASVERFQSALPLEPINRARLARLRVERRAARRAQAIASPYVDRRRQAQINARHALQHLAAGLRAYRAKEQRRQMVASVADGGMKLPDAWLPFVAAR
jgi:hypothetical protein